MNTHLLALQLMAAQGLLGAFDTVYHHELTEALAQRNTAKLELGIHATRALIYGVLFIGLSSWSWHGAWALVLQAIFVIEIILTLWDFVVEDKTRLLPATERVTHTILAINGGAFITLLALNTPEWLAQPTALAWTPQGWLGAFLAACGVGVALSGIRDAFAAKSIGKRIAHEQTRPAIHYGAGTEHVLVTGGTGFIGKLLVGSLLADGKRVTVLARNPKQAAWTFNGKVACVASMQELSPQERVDVMINLAGARILGMRWTNTRKAELRRSRIGITESLVNWIAQAEHKPRLLLNASAIGYYGIQTIGDNRELGEDNPSQDIFMSKLCQEWEAAASTAQAYGVKVKTMRFGLVLGQQGALPMMLLPIQLGLGGALGSGKQWLSWIHVHDLLRAIAFLCAQPASTDPTVEAYNFTAPQTVSQKQFSQIAARVIRRPCFLPTPGLPMRIMLGEQADLLLEGQRVVPTKLLAAGFVFNYPKLKQALQDLMAS